MPTAATPPPPERDEELVQTDDRVIGRAFRYSALVFAVVALAGGGVAWWLLRPGPAAPARITPLAAPVEAARTAAVIPAVRFTDVTAEAGLKFTHFTGAEGEKLLPETMGGGMAFFDFDGDGHQDLLFINGAPWPWAKNPPARPPTHALYRNDGTGRFTDVTAGSGLDVTTYGMGVAVGDFDGDGLVDVFITNVGANRLLRNLGDGRFADVTAAAGVAGDPAEWSTAAAFVDYDRDGRLDLLVVNYVRWSREIDFEVGFKLDGVNRAYGPPMSFEGTFPQLHRNEGDGRFRDVTAEAGLQVRNPATGRPAAKSLGVAIADVNGDGWPDFIVANDTVQNFLFVNQRDGTFREQGALAGVAFDSYGNARGAMGIDTARHRNDGALGIGIANFANEMNALFVAQGDTGSFADEAIPEGIGPASRLLLKFGLFFFDYDLDGWPDLLTANGHLEEDIGRIQQSQTYRQPAQLFWNAGGTGAGGFLPLGPEHAGPDLFQPLVGRGSAFADVDGDGDLDVVITQAGGPPLLLRNDQSLGRHWIRLKLQGTKSNRDAIGAWAEVTSGGVTQWKQVMPTKSYLSQSELPLTFGLGKADRIESVTIHWPDGTRQAVQPESVGINRQTRVVQEG
ncbi:MAG TPA: CRTAC1 family protein [Verrucomicrobiota bacterium]|nr:CRTAC1 family protein [Verrucomicrobiota bacterium]